jgi:DNA-binding GntR family transcriptional regulator
MLRIEQRSIAQQVYAHIKRMILAGDFEGGQRIPEDQIAQQFGVSRTPVREALKQLQAYGLTRYRNRSFVEVISLDREDAAKIARVRANVEGLAAQLLAENVTDEDCRALWELVEECEEHVSTGDLAEAFESDSRLHLEIARRTGNEYLYDIMERLDAKVQLCRISGCLTVGKVAGDVKAHRDIVKAICEGDGEKAARLMEQHAVAFSAGGEST